MAVARRVTGAARSSFLSWDDGMTMKTVELLISWTLATTIRDCQPESVHTWIVEGYFEKAWVRKERLKWGQSGGGRQPPALANTMAVPPE